MLGAGSAAVLGIGEKAVMAAGGRPWMIVTILSRRVAPAVVVVIVALHRRMIVMMVLRRLIAVFIRPVLRAGGQWNDGGQRKHGQGKNDRLPNLITHGGTLLLVRVVRLWAPAGAIHVSASRH